MAPGERATGLAHVIRMHQSPEDIFDEERGANPVKIHVEQLVEAA
jgi:hypothetical protein